MRLNFISSHVWRKRLWQLYMAIGLLAVFQKCDDEARESDAAAVEGVDETVFAVFVLSTWLKASFEADVATSALEIFTVGDAGDFEVGILTSRPDFDIVGLSAGEAEVAGAKLDNAVVKAEQLKDFFGVSEHFFQFCVRSFRGGEFYQFDFVELVDAQHAASLFAGCARLASEARGMSGIVFGKFILAQDFVPMKIGDGDFGGGDQIKLIVFAAVKFLLEFREFAGVERGGAIDEYGHVEFSVTVLASVKIEHEGDEGAFEFRAETAQDNESAGRDFGGALQVEDAEFLAKFPMGEWRAGGLEGWFFAPSTDDFVVGGACAVGNGGVGQGGEIEKKVLEFFVGLGDIVVEGFDIVAERFHGGDFVGSVLAFGF